MSSSVLPLLPPPSLPPPVPLDHHTHLPLPPEPTSPKNATLALRARISHLCKSGRPDLARRLFDALPRPAPAVLWNTVLIGLVCNSHPEEALRFYARMDAEADHYTYSSALKACADARQLKIGKSVHGRILRRLPTKPKNRILNNSLLNMYASCCCSEQRSGGAVEKLFGRLPKRNVVSWNTVIAWYVRIRRPAEALGKFVAMMEAGIAPTAVSFVNVFPAVASSGNKKVANVLYGLLCKSGGEMANDLFAVSSVISMFSELSDTDSARRVFGCAERKNIEVWNAMIGCCVHNGLFEEALDLFTEILEKDEAAVDTVTLLMALIAVSQSQLLDFGRQIHAYVVKAENLSLLPAILLNGLMVMYSRCDSLNDAFDVFHQMPNRDVVSWNTMVSSLVQNGMDYEGLLLAYQMQKEGFSVDSVTATALLSAASNLCDIRMGKEIHAYLIRHGIQCEWMNSYLIYMYSKAGSVETAWKLFNIDRTCDRDQATWNAMIAGYTQSRQFDLAISLFRHMMEENQVPNSVTLSSILPALGPIAGIRLGKEVHGFAIRHCLQKNVFVDTALIDMYSKCGSITCAEEIFNSMTEKNSITYTTMISAFGQHCLGSRALCLFKSMQESCLKPDSITLIAVLSACSYSGLIDEGFEIYESMEPVFGISPAAEHYGCIVDMLGKAGRVDEAVKFAIELGEKGNVSAIWGSLLAACKMHGNLELGKIAAKRLFEIERDDGQAGYHVLLSNVYAAERKWDSVNRIRNEMRKKKLTKEPGSSWVDIGSTTHTFMPSIRSYSEHDHFNLMLEELAADMSFSDYKPSLNELIDGGPNLHS